MKRIVLGVNFFIVVILISIYFNSIRDEKLEKRKEALAIILKVDNANYSGHGALVKYVVDKKAFQNSVLCECAEFNAGDTIMIEYSIEDPNLIVYISPLVRRSKNY